MHTRTMTAWAVACLPWALAGCDDSDATTVSTGGSGGQAGAATSGETGETGPAGSVEGNVGGMAGSGDQAGSGGMAGSGGQGGGAVRVSLELVAEGLVSPVELQAPDDTGRLFIADRVGTIRVVDAAGQLVAAPFLDIQDRVIPLTADYDERGLLGLALHPQFAENGRFFVHYSAPLRAEAPAGFDHTTRISEFRVSEADPTVGDPSSERIVMQVDQPQFNHNGGQIAFGPDGFLYIPLGDGGNADDVGAGHVEDWYEINMGGNGQDIEQNLLGSILRIDVDQGEPYAVPPDNPFAGSPMPEVWAYGFRNPYRMSFDRGGEQQLFVGDVGQNMWEEVSIVTAGGNYGWNVKEGTHCFSTANPNQSLASCPSMGALGEPLIDPILEYAHPAAGAELGGLSVIAGHVYRGGALPALSGHYVFGDWSVSFDTPDGHLFVATPGSDGSWAISPLTVTNRADADPGNIGEFVLSLGQDAAGELYVLTTTEPGPSGAAGKVYRLVP